VASKIVVYAHATVYTAPVFLATNQKNGTAYEAPPDPVVDELIDDVDAALATEERATIIALADELDEYNNLGCPLDAFGRTE
jgi:hypothetical protein